mmetsp:Transcript_31047/g.65892  ORF Transcript_31047/g.65892 Transcript_31047/m.65892 type:complete len:80 (-) Transcript_31047:89-328(-)
MDPACSSLLSFFFVFSSTMQTPAWRLLRVPELQDPRSLRSSEHLMLQISLSNLACALATLRLNIATSAVPTEDGTVENH